MRTILLLLLLALHAQAAEITFHAATSVETEKTEPSGSPYIDGSTYKLSEESFFSPSEILECLVELSYRKESVVISPPLVTTHLMRIKVTPSAARRYNDFLGDRRNSIVVASIDEDAPILRLYFTEETEAERHPVLKIPESTGLLVVRFNSGHRGYAWCIDDQK